jgi:hypothetical protein
MPQVVFSTNLNLDRTYERIQKSDAVAYCVDVGRGRVQFTLKDEENISNIQIGTKGAVNIYCKHTDALIAKLALIKSLTLTEKGETASWVQDCILPQIPLKLDGGGSGYSDSFTTEPWMANEWRLEVDSNLLVSSDDEVDPDIFDPLFPSLAPDLAHGNKEFRQKQLKIERIDRLMDVASAPAGHFMDTVFKNLIFKRYQAWLLSKENPNRPKPNLSVENLLPSEIIVTLAIKPANLDDESTCRVRVKLLQFARSLLAPDNTRFLEMLAEAGHISKADVDHIFVPPPDDAQDYLQRFDSIIKKYEKH